MSYGYVIEAQNGPVKIGRSGNPEFRLKSLRVRAPFPLKLAYIKSVENDAIAAIVERLAHSFVSEFRAHGEWFNVTSADAWSAIERAVHAAPKNVTVTASKSQNQNRKKTTLGAYLEETVGRALDNDCHHHGFSNRYEAFLALMLKQQQIS